MSLCNVISQRERAYLMADAGAWNWDDGTIAQIAGKMVVIPHLRMAFTSRGIGGFDVDWHGWQSARSQREVLDYLPVLAGSISREAIALNPDRPERHNLEVTVVFWNSLEQPQCVQMDTIAAEHQSYLDGWGKRWPDYRPLTWFTLPTFYLTPAVDLTTALPGLRADTAEEVEAIDVLREARRMVEAQRSGRHPVLNGGGSTSLVGGYVEVACVSAHGVTVERVAEWPDDVVGGRI